MTSANTQILKAYEQENMTPEQIAEDQSLDVTAVKAILMQSSSHYRKACNQLDVEDETLNFTNDELRTVNRVIYEAAVGACDSEGNPDYRVRLTAATYIRDDKKGRKEVQKAVGGFTQNILLINEAIQGARSRANEIKDRVTKQLIEA